MPQVMLDPGECSGNRVLALTAMLCALLCLQLASLDGLEAGMMALLLHLHHVCDLAPEHHHAVICLLRCISAEVHEVEESKNAHIQNLMLNHEKVSTQLHPFFLSIVREALHIPGISSTLTSC